MPFIKSQFFDANGVPLSNGTINTYSAGTLNNAVTFTTSGATANNPNPVVLDSAGRGDVFLQANISYKFIAFDQFGTQQWVEDNIGWGTGLLNGAVLIATEQTVTGNKIFSGLTAFGPGANTEYDSGIYDAVFGSNSTSVGGFEVIGTKSANISLTTSEGVLNGGFGYNTATDTLTIFCGGTPVGTITNTSVSFPDAATFTVNGQVLLTNASVIPVSQGGTGQVTQPNALLALTPSTTGNTGNVLTVTGANTIAWQTGPGKPVFLASPYSFFSGASEVSWTSVNANSSAGIPLGVSAVIIDGFGDGLQGGSAAGGTVDLAFACYRISTSYGNASNNPQTDTRILCAAGTQNYGGIMSQAGYNPGAEYPLNANGIFQFIVPTYNNGGNGGWQSLTLRIVGYIP